MGPGSEDQNGAGEHQRDREVRIAYFILLSARYITLEHPFYNSPIFIFTLSMSMTFGNMFCNTLYNKMSHYIQGKVILHILLSKPFSK